VRPWYATGKISVCLTNNTSEELDGPGRYNPTVHFASVGQGDEFTFQRPESQMRAGVWQNVALAAAAGATVVLVYFSPFLLEQSKFPLSNTLVFGLAAAGAAIAAALASVLPNYRVAVVRVLAATAFVYASWRLGIVWVEWLSRLSLSPAAAYWVYKGPGEGVIGSMPSAAIVLIGGRFLFDMSIRQQWNGRLSIAWPDLLYGGTVGIAMSAIAIASFALLGAGRVAWEPNWSSHGVNVFSNLYEEILARGLLLQVARRGGGNWFAMIWTGLIFGSMHGLTWIALAFALVTWIIAWVVLRAGSLWSGWVFHQVIDVIVDSWLH
jgi:membrane protease YdiL (CAAX protease family)